MKPCWEDAGLTEAGAQFADHAIEAMLRAVSACGSEEIANAVFWEACWRLYELPKRTAAYRKKYLRENGPVDAQKGAVGGG